MPPNVNINEAVRSSFMLDVLIESPQYVTLRRDAVPEGAPTNLELEKVANDDLEHICILRRETANLLIQQLDVLRRQVEKNQTISGGSGYLLRTFLSLLFYYCMYRPLKRLMIGGAGGTGKSVTLYRLVHHARESGWLVIYFPRCTLIIIFTRYFCDSVTLKCS